METKDIIVIIIIVLAAVVAGGLSVYQYIDGVESDVETKKLHQKVISTQEKLIKAQEIADKKVSEMNLKLELANKELQIKTEELIKSQKSLIDVQDESLKNIKGFGYAEVSVHPKAKEFYIHSKSNYNMFDLSIEVINYDKLQLCEKRIIKDKLYFSTACYEKNTIRNTIRTLNGNAYADLNYNLDTKNEESHYIIKTIANNITTIQYSIFFNKESSAEFIHVFRIFEVTRDKKEYILLSQSPLQRDEEEWVRRFPYKQNFGLD